MVGNEWLFEKSKSARSKRPFSQDFTVVGAHDQRWNQITGITEYSNQLDSIDPAQVVIRKQKIRRGLASAGQECLGGRELYDQISGGADKIVQCVPQIIVVIDDCYAFLAQDNSDRVRVSRNKLPEPRAGEGPASTTGARYSCAALKREGSCRSPNAKHSPFKLSDTHISRVLFALLFRISGLTPRYGCIVGWRRRMDVGR